MRLFRDYWHLHNAAYMKKRGPINFAQRFYDAFGFAHDAIYPQWKTDKDYKHSWVLLEDLPGYAEKYASVFDNFNIYTTLNHYPLEYAAAREKYREAKLHHERFLNLKPTPSAGLIKERERDLAAIEAAIPKECYVDFGFDFDAGENKPIRDLDEAAFFTIKLLRFFEKKNVPYQMFYTGGRGFHVVVGFQSFEQPLDANNHHVNKAIAKMIEDEAGGLFIDDSIYSSRRQFRLPNSIHNTTGLHKVFLTRDELERGIEHVKTLAAVPRPIPPVDNTPSEYLCRLYGLAKIEVDKKPKYTVKVSDVRDLQAARQSVPVADRPALPIAGLHHPPCIREALEIGVKDGAPANRNMITVFLATYFKAIGRGRDETTASLTDHAVRVLARFSGSGVKEIESSTKGAVATVFRYDKYRFNCGTAKKFCFACNDTCELFKKYRESVYNRRLQKTDMKGFTSLNVYETPEEIRKAIVEREEAYLKRKDGSKALLIRAPAGSGKTTLTFDYLSRYPFQRVCWVASQHALFDNIPDRLKNDWLRIEGRHPDVFDSDGNIIDDANCSRYEDSKRLREKRLNVNRHLCANCADNDACWYLKQFQDTGRHWFIQQKMFLYKAEEFISNFDVVVFDEDILGNFREEIMVTERDVRVFLGYVDTLIEEMEAYATGGTDGYIALRNILDALGELLSRDPPRKAVTGDILHRRLDEICVEMHGISLPDLFGSLGADQYEIIDKIHFSLGDVELPLNFVEPFLRILRFELFDRAKESNLSRLELSHRKRRRAPDAKTSPVESILRVFHKIPMPPCSKPIITLDATGKPDIYSALFEREIELFDAAYKFKNEVWQVFSSASTITALNNPRHLNRMLEGLKRLLELEPCSLIIVKKSLVPIIQKMLPPGAKCIHFFGNRGSNEFMGFKQVIIFGAPGFDKETVLMYASCLYYDRNLSTDTGLVQRTYTGTDKAVNIFCFLEPLIQNILEVSREDEAYQSLNRGRLMLDPSIRLVLLTNIVLEQIPVTRLISLDDLIGKTDDPRSDAHRAIIRELVARQIDTIGFISVSRTLSPFLESGHGPPKAVARYFSDKQAVIPVPVARCMVKRTIERHAKDIADDMRLAPFRLLFKTPRCNGFIEIRGRDSSCVERAAAFFRACPGYENHTFSVPGRKGGSEKC
jgi:hypothetical protein